MLCYVTVGNYMTRRQVNVVLCLGQQINNHCVSECCDQQLNYLKLNECSFMWSAMKWWVITQMTWSVTTPTSSQVTSSLSSIWAILASSWNSSIIQSIRFIKDLTRLESLVGDSSYSNKRQREGGIENGFINSFNLVCWLTYFYVHIERQCYTQDTITMWFYVEALFILIISTSICRYHNVTTWLE